MEVLCEGAWRRSGCLLEVCQRVSELGMQPKGFINNGNMREGSLVGRRGWVLER